MSVLALEHPSTLNPLKLLVQLPNAFGFGVPLTIEKTRIWSDSLAIPAYIASLSILAMLAHIIASSRPVKNLWARITERDAVPDSAAGLSFSGPRETTYAAELSEHVKEHGGSTIFGFKVARLVGCSVFLALLIWSIRIDEETHFVGAISSGKGRKHRGKDRHKPMFTKKEWLELALCMTALYTVLLAFVSVSARRKWSKIATRHLNTLLLSFLAAYIYRDIFPLATFDRVPMDLAEGWVLWAKIGAIFLAGVVIPLTIPRRYVPAYPEAPMLTPNPEQTASILSLALYSFLDPVVFLANRVSHLSSDLLPPLADYDQARYLKAKSFPHLDAFMNARKRHLFFGLMRVFRVEYLILAAMIIIHVVAGFASPLGIKNLLHYLETNGENATIKPWFWILWLFLGPTVGSLSFQWYIFIATRTLVRVECIITQLVFEHALRIRVKAETKGDSDSSAVSTVSTPDSASLSEPQRSGYVSEDETLLSRSATETTVAANAVDGGSPQSPNEPVPPKSNQKSQGKPSDEKSGTTNLVGKINNLVTTDLGNIVDSRDFLFMILYIPLQITLCIAFLYKVLGWSSFVGLATIILLFPLPGYVAKLVQDVQVIRLKKTDARVEMVSETMNVLRMVKLFGWEGKMDSRIADKREEELRYIWKRQILDLINGSLNFLIPIATMIATYTTLCVICPLFLRFLPLILDILSTVIMKRQLSASIVFSSMTVFDMLRDQLQIVFFSVSQSITGKVSLDRVDDFLNNTELLDRFDKKGHQPIHPNPVLDSEKIGFNEASFTWSNDTDGSLTPSKRNFVLRIENQLNFALNGINLIVGPTGSGKTSLLMALLGEMHYIPLSPNSWFNLPREGGVAYAAQESWVQNETIKENILFGSPFDEERYNKVIYQCGLTRDLSMFDAGDETEVGEKGLTLSGGQKARITMARAIYSPAKILLLDDVLAALDVHTSKWIIEKCLSGDLVKGRTVILITHNVALATPIASFVVSLGSDGRILSQGSISEALKLDRTLAKELKADEELNEKADDEIDPQAEPTEPVDGKLIIAEEVEEGHVSWSALKLYFSGLGGNHPILFFSTFVLGLGLCEMSLALQTWFLGFWASQYSIRPPSEVPVFQYLGVYGLLLLLATTVYFLAYVIYILGSIRASRTLHKSLIESVLGTTLRWLDITPISRVITRCTQDIRAVDGPISSGLWYLSEMTLSMLIKFGAVVLLTPVFLFPGIAVAVLGGWCGQIYIAAQLSVKREMSNAKAPVMGHFGAAISGLTSLRAYGAQESFINESLNRINRYTRAARTFYNLNRWVCIRIDAMGGLFASGLAAYLVYFQNNTASNTGFSLNMAVGFSGMILWWIRVLNDFEVQGNSLERIEKYITIEQEPEPSEGGQPPAYWPATGELHVEGLSARYSSDGPKVLHDISFDVKSGERIGIVGRTGSGKSSLTLALLRCIYTEGRVFYAGRDTSTLNLDALRSNITIIPQMPELLSGSLRQNLDPFDQYDDAALNDALRSAGLFSLQQELEDGRITLDTKISSGGGNLSVGQRQIIALARAIIRGSKLLILDEATSAIDHKTDSIIQSSLRHELGGDVTVITVAHRLQTIMDADKIMVLDAGRMVEFDKPSELIKDPNGKLRSLVDESGDREALIAMAQARSQI